MDDEEKVLGGESDEEPQPPAEPEYITKDQHEAQQKELYDKLNATLSKQGAENKRLKQELDSFKTQPPPIDTTAFVQESIALENLKNQAREDPTVNAQVTQQQAKVDALSRAKTAAETKLKIDKENAEQRVKLEEQITEAGLNPDDDSFEGVWDAFDFASAIDGNFAKAQRKLDRALKKEKPVEETKSQTPTETPNEDKIREDERLKVMREHGLLVTDDGGPSASSASWAKFQDDYNAGKVTVDEYHKRGKKEGRL